MSTETFWTNDIMELISFNKFNNYIPSTKYTLEKNLNVIVRLTIIISVILSLYYKEVNYLGLIVFALLVTYIIHKYYNKKEKYIEHFDEYINEVSPTIDNPFMNVLQDDYIERPNRTIPDILCNPEIKREIEEDFEYGLVDIDVFGRKNSQRQYYTVPVTTIPNKQLDLANWLYKTPLTCKENNGFQCVGNNTNDLRQASLFRNPLI